jgi:hypothetical protein
MRRPFAFVAVALAALALTELAGAQDPPAAVGWWSTDPTAQPQPEGGFQVAAALGEPASVAALRFSTPSGVTSATLTLTESGGFVTDASSLQVCTTTDPWTPANPGPMDDAPAPQCASPIALTRDAEAATWTAEVGPLLPSLGGDPSLMIVPGETPGAGSPLDPGFRVSFSAATLAVVAAPGTTTSTTAFSPPGGSGGSGGGGGFQSGPPPPSSSSGGGSFSGPGPVAPPTTVADTTTATVPEPDPTSGEAFAAPDFAAGATPGGGRGGDQPWERLLFLVPLAAAAGVGSVYIRRLLTQRGVVEA